MAFIKGFRVTDGYLKNEVFQFAAIDANDISWNAAPGQYAGRASIGSGYMGGAEGADFGGISFSLPDVPLTGWDQNYLLAALPIEGSQDQLKRELRFIIRGVKSTDTPTSKNYTFLIQPYLRTWTDDTTYVDTQLGNANSVQFHRNDGTGVNAGTTYCTFGNIIYQGHHYVIIGPSQYQYQDVIGFTWIGEYVCYEYNDFFLTIGGGTPHEEEFSPEFGPGSEPEGYDGGSFDYHSDPIDMPTKPQSVLSLGFVNVYKCGANSLIDFGAALFPEITWPTTLTEVGEVLAAVSDSIWNSKLIDYVVSVHCVPGDVTAGALEDIKVGARTMTGILARKISDEYFDFDFGTLHTDPIYRNFMDQMCSAELYLPFYGFISLKPEQWNGGDISVKYRINVIDGSFTAFVFSQPAKSEMDSPGLIGQYGGSCVVHLPVSSMSYASMFSGMVGGAAQAAGGVATGNISMAVSGAATAAGATGGGDAKMSNSYNASSSFMTRRRPYLLISAPVPSFSTRYNIEQGLPTNQSMVLGTCTGLVKASNPILDGIPCTDNERDKIRAALASGLIF